ncbi:MAG TPA: tetratricopeptide repeat protein [Vicinamibacterales bacterium]|nr:tetratricopeptide repeat protein [Vicinamibacterales bacterium]
MPVKLVAGSRRESSSQAARQQLDRILGSRTFQPVERLKRFLTFVVTETLDGRGDQLKEYVIAVQVFGKEESFDPRTDPLVRVQARRLRARLERYYRDEGSHDELMLELPKGGYTPTIKPRDRDRAQPRAVGVTIASQNSIAVLPISDDTQDARLGPFCRGTRDEIIHALSKMGGLRVVAATVETPQHDPRDIAQRFDAATIITGSARASDERIRLVVHVVDGVSGRYVWSEAREASPADTLAVQEAIAGAILARLQPDEGSPTGTRGFRRASENLAAHNLYLQGRYHLNQRTEEGLQKALDFFEKAVLEDPRFAQAHSGLADAYGLCAHYAVRRPVDVWTKAASSAATAVMLDGNSSEAHTSLAHVRSTQDWDWFGAEREFLRAIALDPNYSTAHHWYAMSCLVPMERLDEAREQMQQAQALDPVSSIIARDLAMTQYYRRDFDAALDQCDHTIELNPHFSPAYWLLGFIQEQRGDLDESIAAFQRAVHLSPLSPRMQSALARALALSGKRQQALKLLKTLEEMAPRRYVSPFELAVIHLALGHRELGLQWLSKAADDRAFEMTSLTVDPRLESIRESPEYHAVVRRLGLP